MVLTLSKNSDSVSRRDHCAISPGIDQKLNVDKSLIVKGRDGEVWSWRLAGVSLSEVTQEPWL